ncbi:iron chelate uptake ABC transporter family permease subunit [Agreia pratensis]|uniref:Iron complex transport system permease protein n=1 Tax=Agreia pratensis TaxID=150121 RepID=A0A1X7INJ8_9MICO|nr:iron chelate uptake ABC transporter family permease subunit [Agreia pratensis]MBF4632964.1 iron chelate uptake ABC transporter family permease subunit [Agreia pratensis]SMG16590.1 iron complex transport system permease protein [Agreia pratensis]
MLTFTRPATRVLGFFALLVVVLLSVGASLLLGSRSIDVASVFDAVFSRGTASVEQMVVLDLRVPRTIIGLVAGAALGLAGALMQGLTRNPLADPGLLGVNAGASLAVVAAIAFFGVTAPSGYVWFAFGGAALAAALVYAVASGRTGPSPLSLTLAGAATTAVLTSFITLILLRDLDTLAQFRFWSAGSLVGRDVSTVATVSPFLVVGAAAALLLGRSLNSLALGDDVARGLGQRVGLTRIVAGVAIILLCGSATSLAGPLVFVGLVVPHIVRRFVGADYRWILLWSMPLGAALLVIADTVGRLIAPPSELEAGIVVALIGAPALIVLVRGNRAVTR